MKIKPLKFFRVVSGYPKPYNKPKPEPSPNPIRKGKKLDLFM